MTVVSSDKDLMQLVQPGLVMLDTMKNRTIGPDEVREKFGVPPDKVVDVQALAGDSTDNVPGVPGIGVKTAAELINEYGDLETLLARAGEIKQPKRRERLTEFALQARLSLDLVTLKDDVPVDGAGRAARRARAGAEEPAGLPARDGVRDADQAHRRGLEGRGAAAGRAARGIDHAEASQAGGSSRRRRRSLAAKRRAGAAGDAAGRASSLAANAAKAQKIDRSKYETVTELAQLEAWIAEARAAGRFAFDTETTSLDAMQAEFVGFSLAVAPGRACYVPLGHRVGARQLRFRRWRSEAGAGQRRRWPLLKPLLEDAVDPQDRAEPQVRLPRAAPARHRAGPLDDTMLLSYALDGGRGQHGMDALAERHLGHTCMLLHAGAGARAGRQEVRQDVRARCRSTRRRSTPPRTRTSRCGCGWC
mgnify:CR=1 FL=1